VTVQLPPRPGVTTTARVTAGGTVRAAVALLTRLPVRPDDGVASGAAAFPVVGVIVGLVGGVPLVLGGPAEPVLSSLLAVAAMTVLTGALHLDGLADTADALLAPDPTSAERARKDPAVGPGGAVALILVLGTEVAALSSVVATAGALTTGAALVVAAVVGRTLPVVAVVLAGSRATGSGFGGWFAARVGPADTVVAVVVAVLVTAGLAIATGSPEVAVGGIVGAGAGLAIAWAIVARRRQLDGDGMGAIIELTVAASLAAAAYAHAL
jgi:adenosylcobinamide-GDP ribazoletransferase